MLFRQFEVLVIKKFAEKMENKIRHISELQMLLLKMGIRTDLVQTEERAELSLKGEDISIIYENGKFRVLNYQ